MKKKRKPLMLIGVVAGLLLGFAIRWVQHGGAGGGGVPTPSPSSLTAGGQRPAAAAVLRGRKVTPLVAELAQRLSISSGVTRWLEWMTALEKATPADFPHLARMAKGDPPALRMIATRWIELHPTHLFETLIATAGEIGTADSATFSSLDLGRELFDNWARRDPAGAVAALSRPDLPVGMRGLRFSAVGEVMKVDPETAIKTIADWHLDHHEFEPGGLARWVASNPQHAAEFALAHAAGATTDNILDVIGKTWAKTDPEAALSFASGLKGKPGRALATGIVQEWAEKDVGKAAAWLAAADPAVRDRLNGPVVEIWARTDIAGALEWMQQNLSGSSLDEALAPVIKGAAEKSVSAAADLVTGMVISPGRIKAAVAVAKKWFPDGKPVPAEAIVWMGSLDPVSVRQVVEQTMWQWAASDPHGFADFLVSPAGENAPDSAYSAVAREMTRKSPVEALEWAARLPEARRSGAAVSVFTEWQNAQPAAALEWLRKLPGTDPRCERFYLAVVGNYSSGAESSAAAKALASGNTAAAREAIHNLPVPEENKQKIMERLQLHKDSARAAVDK